VDFTHHINIKIPFFNYELATLQAAQNQQLQEQILFPTMSGESFIQQIIKHQSRLVTNV